MAFSDFNTNDARDCANGMSLIMSLYPEGRIGTVQAAAYDLIGETTAVQVYPSTLPFPPFVTTHQGDWSLVASGGVQNAQQGLLLFAASSLSPVGVGQGQVNYLELQAAQRILSAVMREVEAVPRNWILLGHSYGGAIVQVLAILLKMAGMVSNFRIVTYGSPRAGDLEFTYGLPILNNRRLMCAFDPVPRFPAHFDEAPLTSAVLGIGVVASWQNYAQGPGGTILFDDGSMRKAELPLARVPDAGLSLVEWLTNSNFFGGAQHSETHYLDALTVAAQTRFAAAEMPAPTIQPEPIAPLTTIELQEAVAHPTTPSPVVRLTGVPTVAYIPPAYTPDAQNVGGTWCVVWMTFVVMRCSKRTTARSIAKYLRSYLRRQQSAASISAADWQNANQQYLQAVGRADLGFKPPLVVT